MTLKSNFGLLIITTALKLDSSVMSSLQMLITYSTELTTPLTNSIILSLLLGQDEFKV